MDYRPLTKIAIDKIKNYPKKDVERNQLKWYNKITYQNLSGQRGLGKTDVTQGDMILHK